MLLSLKQGATAKSRPVQDLDTLRQFSSGPGPAAIFDLPWLPLYIGIVYAFHSLLGLLALAGALIICLLTGLNEILLRRPAAQSAETSLHRLSLVEEGRRNSEAVQAMGMAGALTKRWDKENGRHLAVQACSADRSGLFGTAIKAFRFILQSAVLGLGAWLAINQEITAGVMIAASILTTRALAPVEQAVSQWRGFVAARQSLARLRLALASVPDEQELLELPEPTAEVRLEQVSSGPVDAAVPVVEEISFALQAGEGLGIVGPSGSGKSTLARAIVGGAKVFSGAIRYDGAELAQWREDQIGGFIGYLPQDVQLFDGTVAENISRFDLDPSAGDITAAAKLADVHEMIVTLPEGYNTVIGNGGYGLSRRSASTHRPGPRPLPQSLPIGPGTNPTPISTTTAKPPWPAPSRPCARVDPSWW